VRAIDGFPLFLAASGVPALASGRVGKIYSVRDNGHASAAPTRRRFSLGLRTRVTLAFAVAGLIVAVGLSLITYSLARSFLLQQRDNAARTQAYSNARFVKDRLRDPHADVGRTINDVRTEGGGFALIHYDNRWFPQAAGLGQDAVPADLRDAVLAGNDGRQRYRRDGDPYLAVGLYIAANDAAYFEVFPDANLQRTMSVIGTSLAVGATVTTLVAAGLGWWASRRLLNPLSRVADAASELAEGGLDTRLPEESDPDLHRLVSSFNNMADALQDRIEREERFASDVSHELRSPLTALTAAVEVLDARREELPARSQQALDVVTSQVRRFDQMVLDLLEISRLDAGVTDFNPEPVLLGDLVRRIAARYGFETVPVWVDHRWAERPVPVEKRRLERILANLLGNAEAHAGGPTRIAVEDAGANTVHLVVEDAGPGVMQSERTRIFERFARGSAARHRVGTGLGLALVTEHAAIHGGAAWVEDRPGGGSRFVVSFPVEPQS
jgi:signal transduction histidine kinase